MPGVRLVKANDSRRPPGRRRTRPDRLTFCCDAPAAGHAAILESRSSYVTVSEHRAQDNATFVTSQAPLRLPPMLLSDRDLLVEIDGGSLSLDPFDASLIQPSSIDVRLDRYFRVFNNSKYTHIDPKIQQDELTTLVEVDGDDAFVLHPGEFVLGSTFEAVSLSDSLARPAWLADPLHRGVHRSGVQRPHHPRAVQRGEPADHPLARHEDRAAVPVPADLAEPAPLRFSRVRLAVPRPARPDAVPGVPELPAGRHQALTRST